jgi:two-component system CheB/CheR fusion protein
MRVLIVDDDHDSAADLATLLVAEGCDVRIEVGVRAGADTAEAWSPDVALLDIALPSGGAYVVARRLRADGARRAACLVAMSAWGQKEDRRQATAAGFDHHLVKPIDPLHLRVLVNAVAARLRDEGNGDAPPWQAP